MKFLTDQEVDRLNALDTIEAFPVDFRRPSLHPAAAVRRSAHGTNELVATGPIAAGAVVLAADGEKFDRPLQYSLQFADRIHTLGMGAMNHRCVRPACHVHPATGNLIAARNVETGAELDFNYLTTEAELAVAFRCNCGAERCFGLIAGFSALDRQARRELMENLPVANHLRDIAGS